MKAYKVELLIVDHDRIGSDEIKETIENQKYPNYCISPDVMNIVEKEIGEWSDEHPLNYIGSVFKEYERLFETQPASHPSPVQAEAFSKEKLWDEHSRAIPEQDYEDGQEIAAMVAGKSIMFEEDFLASLSAPQDEGWVSVEDRLPEVGELVLCSNAEDCWVVAGHINNNRAWYNQFQDFTTDTQILPTHWRKLPSPPNS